MGRGLASAALLISALQAVIVARTASPVSWRVAGLGLAVASAVAALSLLWRGTSSRVRVLAALLLLQVALLGLLVVAKAPPYRPRLVFVALLASYGALLLTLLLAAPRIVPWSEALLVSFFLASVLVGAEWFVSRRMGSGLPKGPAWSGGSQPHQALGGIYPPSSTLVATYPDNPRRYFDSSDPRPEMWRVETHEGAVAQAAWPEDRRVVRVELLSSAGSALWHARVMQQPLRVRRGARYALGFEARAAAPRRIAYSVSQAHEPWEPLGLYTEAPAGPEWQRYYSEFLATADDERARIDVQFGGSSHAVELKDVALRELTGGQVVAPPVTARHSVTFRFNALGCRGGDYATPRPAGVVRTVVLGDAAVLGVGVHERDTLSAQLEHILNERAPLAGSGGPREVINCGVAGYSPREQRLAYDLFSARYDPQVVLLGVTPRAGRSWTDDAHGGFPLRPSRLELISSLWRAFQNRQRRRHAPDVQASVEGTRVLAEACRQRGARLGVFVFRISRREEDERFAQAFNDALSDSGIPRLDLGAALLKERAVGDLMVHPADDRPNEVAHRLAADELARFLDREKLLGGPPPPGVAGR